jgi:hypothetical protein
MAPTSLSPAYGKCTYVQEQSQWHFTDVTENAGVATLGWTTSAVWVDYDNDGRLDLFVSVLSTTPVSTSLAAATTN